jgi:ubiquinone biosynthesis protein
VNETVIPVLALVGAVRDVVLLVVALVVFVAATFVAVRLLGVRRGWLQTVVAAVVAWIVALVVTASLLDWDWGADRLGVFTVLLAVPLTMALLVANDLFARPGTLARGDRAGLVAAPRPISGVRSKLEPLSRYRELIGILRRHQLLGRVRGGTDDDAGLAPAPVRLREALEEAGGVYVKLGQIAATRIDLLPASVCEELSKLQSRSNPISAEAVRGVLEAELGRPVEEVFDDFDWEPLASASIGQTHTAVLRDGEEVVVKVQRPGVDAAIERDLAALNQLARLAERRSVIGRDLRVSTLAEEFGRSLRSELDFTREAQSTRFMHDMAERDESPVRVPSVHPELCTRRMMVQERLHGVPLSEVPADRDLDRDALARQLLSVNITNILERGVFHADPHPGNVMVLDDGTLGMIDYGATGRLDSIQEQAVIDMLIALVRRDAGMLRDGVERVADVGAHVSRDRLDRSLARLLAENVSPGGGVSVQALTDLIPVLGEFDISLPGDLVVLMRALVTLDGTLGVLSPGFSVVAAGRDLAQQAAQDQGGDPTEMLQQALLEELPVLRRLPADVARTLALASRGSLQFRTVQAEDEDRFQRTLWNRVTLAFVGATLAVVSVLVMGLEVGPRLGGDTRLVVLLGAGGLFLGVVLLLRVAAAIVRDGTT